MKTIIMFLMMLFTGIFIGFLFFQKKQENFSIQNIQSTVIKLIESKQELITNKMTIQKTIEGKKELSDLIPSRSIDDKIGNFLFKDEIVLLVEADVLAGFDMTNIGSGILVNQDGSVNIILPEPKVLYVNLNKNTKTQDRKTGIFTKGDIKLETNVRNGIQEEIKNQAIGAGILDNANTGAEQMLRNILSSANIKLNKIIIQNNLKNID